MDYWINTGDSPNCTTHHLVIVPDWYLIDSVMNDTNTTAGGYLGSKMFQSVLGGDSVRGQINNAFGANQLLSHRNLYSSTVGEDGRMTGGDWINSTLSLLNEPMVYGTYMFTPGNTGGTTYSYIYTIDKTQLALFRLNPLMINPGRFTYWLRDVVSSTSFAISNGLGYCGEAAASNAEISVRPVFGITGAT